MTVDSPATTATVRSNPYVGPESFRRGDRIYGRDRAAAELLDLLVAERIVLLHSPSGAGKTSLIQARMLALLEEEHFDVLPVVRLNHEPPAGASHEGGPRPNRYVLSALMSLEEGRPREEQRTPDELAGLTLAEYVAQRAGEEQTGGTVLVIDQFEEVITADPVDQAAKRTFFRQLGALLGDRTIWALLSMREDFLAELDPYARLVPTRFTNRYRLDLLTQEEALDAVVYPAQDAGVEFDAAAAGKLVDDLRTVRLQRGGRVLEELGPYVEPVQLQVVCRGLWERRDTAAGVIGLDDVAAVGDVDQALAAYYATCMASTAQATGVPERALREWCEENLITPQGFRGQAMHGPAAAGAADEKVLDLLTRAHLLRAESRRGAVWFELAHDRLVDPIKEDNEAWRRTNLSDVERRAEIWDEQHRSDGLLLTGPELVQAEEWATSRTLTDVEDDFLAASRVARDRARREARANARIRRWLILAVVGLVVALITSALAISSTISAGEATVRATEAAALGQSLGALPNDVQLSLRLAIEASALRDTKSGDLSEEAVVALQQAVSATPVRAVMRANDSPALSAVLSRDGTRAASLHEDLTLAVWDAATGRRIWSTTADSDSFSLALSADGGLVALGSTKGVRIWDVSTDGAPRTVLDGRAVDEISFSPGGDWLLADDVTTAAVDGETEPPMPDGAEAGRLVAVSLTDGRVRSLRGGPGWYPRWVGDGPWSPRGSRLVTFFDGSLQVRDSPGAQPEEFDFDGADDVTISQDGSVVAAQRESETDLYDGLGGDLRLSLEVEAAPASLSRDGRLMLVMDLEDGLQLYDTETGDLLRRVVQPGSLPSEATLDPEHPDRALVVGSEGELTVWDVSAGAPDWQQVLLQDVAGGTGVTMTDAGVVRRWSSDARMTRTLDLPRRLGLPPAPVPRFDEEFAEGDGPEAPDESVTYFLSAAVSPDGEALAVALDRPGRPYVVSWDPKSAPVRPAIQDSSHVITSLTFSGSGRYLVGTYYAIPPDEVSDADAFEGAVGEESGVYVWEAATGKVVHRWADEVMPDASQPRVSPDERELLGTVGESAVVWDLATGERRLTLSPPSMTPSASASPRGAAEPPPAELYEGVGPGGEEPQFLGPVAWSPDGGLIATALEGPRGSSVLLWDARTGTQSGADLTTHNIPIATLAFDESGRRLVAVTYDSVIYLWDVPSRTPILQVNQADATDARFLGSDDRALVFDYGGRPSVLYLDGQELLATATSRSVRDLSVAECTRYIGEGDLCSAD